SAIATAAEPGADPAGCVPRRDGIEAVAMRVSARIRDDAPGKGRALPDARIGGRRHGSAPLSPRAQAGYPARLFPRPRSRMSIRKLRLAALAAAALLVAACGGPPAYTGGDVPELQRVDIVEGEGDPAAAGDEVSVHYTGWLYDENASDRRGARFDSSRDRGQPFVFRLGAGRVIRGWDEGVAGMRPGGRRELYIPAWLGYGERGAGKVIPPGASLVFEVELLDVRR